MIYNYSSAWSLNTILRTFLSICFLSTLLASCNTLRSHSKADSLETITAEGSFLIRVRSGNSTIDDEIHRSAVYMFSRYLSVSDAKQTNGHIDIMFSSRIKNGQSSYPKNLSYEKSWYTGNNMPEISELTADINSAGMLDGLSSTMTLRIYGHDESELWSARHEMTLPSPLIRRADQAALHNLETIISEFEKTFLIKDESVPVEIPDKMVEMDRPHAAQQVSNNNLQEQKKDNISSADIINSLHFNNDRVMPAMLIIQGAKPEKADTVKDAPHSESPETPAQ